MDIVTSFLAVSSGYIIAFAVGAWIGRPLLGLLTDRIFKK
jgi:membrane protein DedA with SNARE-associated domain